VQIPNFTGRVVYHPKVYLAHDRSDRPIRFLLGSANLSGSAFNTSIEAGMLGDEKRDLNTLSQWFNELFEQRSALFTPERLRQMAAKWRLLAALRARHRLHVRRLGVPAPAPAAPVEPEDADTLEDVFATIQLPIGLLNMDYARNNVRSIAKLREVLAYPRTAHSKQSSELKLLGFMLHGQLTTLGQRAARAGTNEAVARLWCEWLQQTPDDELRATNGNLLVAKRVFPQFWRLRREVRDYFLANAQNPEDRRLVQTIELLCNARHVVQALSLNDMRTLSALLSEPQRVPDYVRTEVAEYFGNKGARTWGESDRRDVPLAWRAAVEGLRAQNE
jgi:hypothetical protein